MAGLCHTDSTDGAGQDEVDKDGDDKEEEEDKKCKLEKWDRRETPRRFGLWRKLFFSPTAGVSTKQVYHGR